MEVVRIIRDHKNIKKPKLLPDNVLKIFAPKKLLLKPAEYQQNDSGVVIILHEKVKGYFWSLDGDITDFNSGENRPHFGFLNQNFTLKITIEKGNTFGFVRLFSDADIRFESIILVQRRPYRKRRQRGDFAYAYAGQNIVNQLGKIAPGIIKDASSQINDIAQQHINQAITDGGKELERVLPKILRGAIEDIYQTPFRLLGDFGKKQFNKLKKKLS